MEPPVFETEETEAAATGVEITGPGAELFQAQCTACHTIGGGDGVGPDLAGVTDRRDREWLVRWIADPASMLESDPIAQELLAQYNNVPMPNLPLTEEDVETLVDLLERLGGGAEAAVADGPAEEVEITEAEWAQATDAYFASCASCHGMTREGTANGPAIGPEESAALGTVSIRTLLTTGGANATEAFTHRGLVTGPMTDVMARFVQLELPEPPALDLAAVTASWNTRAAVNQAADGDWVSPTARAAGTAIELVNADGSVLTRLELGENVVSAIPSSDGRFVYGLGEAGTVGLVDLWTESPTINATARACYEATTLAFAEDTIGGARVSVTCAFPAQSVDFDPTTLEPAAVAAR